ncbi:MAG: phosphatidylglycerophosphatase A, partial [Pseudomonadota bacterium]
MTIDRIIGTFFGAGYLRPAPGTWGSLAALPGALALHWIGGFALIAVGTVIAFAAGLWATGKMTAGSADHDPSEIVIDEVAGQWIALWPRSFAATTRG